MEDDLLEALETARNKYASAKKAKLENQEKIEKESQRGRAAAEATAKLGWRRAFDAAIVSEKIEVRAKATAEAEKNQRTKTTKQPVKN